MKYLLIALGLVICVMGCGFNPTEGDWIPGDFEYREKACFDTTYVHTIDDDGGVDTVVTPQTCAEDWWL